MKINKKKCAFLITTFMLFSSATTIWANNIVIPMENVKTAEINSGNVTSKYYYEEGEVIKVVNQNDFKRIIVKDASGDLISYNAEPYIPILSGNRVLYSPVVGDYVQVAVLKNEPVTKTNPPQKNIKALFVTNKNSSDKMLMDKFDKNFLNGTASYTLTFDNGTTFHDKNLDRITSSKLNTNNDLIVFYSPYGQKDKGGILAKKVFEVTPEPSAEVKSKVKALFASFDAPTIYDRGEIQYVALSAIAENLGITLEWNGEENSVLLKSVDTEYKIFIDQDNFSYKGVNCLLTNPPILHESKTYIPVDLAFNLAYRYYNK